MYSSTYLSWFRRLLVLGAVVAGLTASAAGARLDPGTPPDVSDVASRLAVTQATDVSRPPDVRDAAASVTQGPAYSLGPGYLQYTQKTGWFSPALVRGRSSVPDVFERYAAAHPNGFDVTSSEVSRPPDITDTLLAATANSPTESGQGPAYSLGPGLLEYQQGTGFFAPKNTTPEGLKADGLRWRGIAQVYKQQSDSTPALRPDDRAGPLGVGEPTSVPVSSASSFDWNDYAIGIGTGIGVALLLGAGLLAGRRQRHRVQPA
jgi:hypothetical protein